MQETMMRELKNALFALAMQKGNRPEMRGLYHSEGGILTGSPRVLVRVKLEYPEYFENKLVGRDMQPVDLSKERYKTYPNWKMPFDSVAAFAHEQVLEPSEVVSVCGLIPPSPDEDGQRNLIEFEGLLGLKVHVYPPCLLLALNVFIALQEKPRFDIWAQVNGQNSLSLRSHSAQAIVTGVYNLERSEGFEPSIYSFNQLKDLTDIL